jgi:cold shock protein
MRWACVESMRVRVRRDSLVVEPDEPLGVAHPEHPAAKAAPDRPESRREVGRLRWFNEEKDYGFIESPSGEDRFFRRSGLLCDLTELKPGLPLEFEAIRGERGPVAFGIRPLRLRSSG